MSLTWSAINNFLESTNRCAQNTLASFARRVVATVHNLEFQHVTHFLKTLEGKSLDAFQVRQDGTSDRRLMIELHAPYTNSCMETLPIWIDTVHSLAGPGKRAELAILYKIAPTPGYDIRAPAPLIVQLYDYHKQRGPGGGKIEAYKFLVTLYARSQADCYMRNYPRVTLEPYVSV